jgi:hypothetical protein
VSDADASRPRYQAAIVVSRVLVGIAALPMLLVTLLFVGSIGMECMPGRAHTAGDELGGAAVAWGVFLVPALPAVLFGRGRPRLWRVIVALILPLVAGALAIAMIGMAALAHMG